MNKKSTLTALVLDPHSQQKKAGKGTPTAATMKHKKKRRTSRDENEGKLTVFVKDSHVPLHALPLLSRPLTGMTIIL